MEEQNTSKLKQNFIKIIFVLLICIFCAVVGFWGYETYRENKYVENAIKCKTYIYNATEAGYRLYERTVELELMSDAMREKWRAGNYKSQKEAQNAGNVYFGIVMDNNWEINDSYKYSSHLLDSCEKESNKCMKIMRDYSYKYPEDHQSLEEALKLAKAYILKTRQNTKSRIYYREYKEDYLKIMNCLSISDVNIGEISDETKKKVNIQIGNIMAKSFHNEHQR